MNVTVDIGNTCIKIVAYDGIIRIANERIEHGEWHKLKTFCDTYNVTNGILSSVVPASLELQKIIDSLPFTIERFSPITTYVPLNIRYSSIETLGSDRLASAVGAYLKSKGNDILIIDIGTCITYDFVTAIGDYLGGNISPGPTMRFRALKEFTGLLPMVERKGETPLIGSSTHTAIRSGVMLGVEREIEGYIRFYSRRNPNLHIYLTGGMLSCVHIKRKKYIFVDEFLVSEGLNEILLHIHRGKN